MYNSKNQMNTFLYLIKIDYKQQGLIIFTFSMHYNCILSHSRTWKVFKLVYLSSGVFKGVLDTTLCDKLCEWLVTGRWFSQSTSVSSTNKTDRHDITEILLKVALNKIKYISTNFTYLWRKDYHSYNIWGGHCCLRIVSICSAVMTITSCLLMWWLWLWYMLLLDQHDELEINIVSSPKQYPDVVPLRTNSHFSKLFKTVWLA